MSWNIDSNSMTIQDAYLCVFAFHQLVSCSPVETVNNTTASSSTTRAM